MKVLLIGTGAMSSGIAQLLLSNDKIDGVFIKSRGRQKFLEFFDKIDLKIKKHWKNKSLDLLKGAVLKKKLCEHDEQGLSHYDVIIEAVSENIDVKKKCIEEVRDLITESTIVASNTSSLSITELSLSCPYPDRFVGIHFFNPAPVMELVEVVVGQLTSQDTVSRARDFSIQLGKKPVVVDDSPGFVVNRMLIPMINEAVTIVAEGTASIHDVDAAMRFGAHHPMGPLSLADFIGLDVVVDIMATLHHETGDQKYRVHPLLKRKVRAKELGRKSGKGFYEY